MPAEKATGLIVRTTDYSDTSRIATIWTRELGKVRVLAKGGRRLKSSFDSALDLLTVCSIVLLRKGSGGLDLLTEAQVVERFPQLRKDLAALYAAYYIAELLGDWTEDYDPHPQLFDEAVDALRTLGTSSPASQVLSPESKATQRSGLSTQHSGTGLRLLRFEMVLLRELGYAPILDACAGCRKPLDSSPLAPRAGSDSRSESATMRSESATMTFSSAAGGMVCGQCRVSPRGKVTLSRAGWEALKQLGDAEDWRKIAADRRAELRQLFNQYISYLLGRRPRTMAYLGS
jgi:DNA repair protein RecO (recombination protein O)